MNEGVFAKESVRKGGKQVEIKKERGGEKKHHEVECSEERFFPPPVENSTGRPPVSALDPPAGATCRRNETNDEWEASTLRLHALPLRYPLLGSLRPQRGSRRRHSTRLQPLPTQPRHGLFDQDCSIHHTCRTARTPPRQRFQSSSYQIPSLTHSTRSLLPEPVSIFLGRLAPHRTRNPEQSKSTRHICHDSTTSPSWVVRIGSGRWRYV